MQMKVDRRFKNGFLITNSYTLGRATATTPVTEREHQRRRSTSSAAGADASTIGSTLRQQLRLRPSDPRRTAGWGTLPAAGSSRGCSRRSRGRRRTSRWTARCCGRRATRQRPDMNADANIIGDIGAGQPWFDTSVFTAPAANTFGNVTRNGPASTGRPSATSMARS